MNPPCLLRLALALLLLVLPSCRSPSPASDAPGEIPPGAAASSSPGLSGDSSTGEVPLPPDASEPLSRLYILRWNPDISSFTDATFREGFARLRDDGDARTNWSLHEWEGVRPGDWALFVRVGGGGDGIVGLCRFLSAAYEGASWRGDGTTDHYADIDILLFNDPAFSGLFAAGELDTAFPSVDWHGGHSGVLVAPALAESLALHIADRLARLDEASFPPDALTVAPLSGDGPRAIACALLSRLCPRFKCELPALPPPAGGDLWLPEPGIDIVYAPARLAPNQTLLDSAFRIDPALAATFDFDDAFFAADLLAAAARPGENAIVSPLAADTLISALALGARDTSIGNLCNLFGPVVDTGFWKDRIRRNNFVLRRNHGLLRSAAAPGVPLPQYAADAGAAPDASPDAGLGTRLSFRTLDGLSPGYADLFGAKALDIPIDSAPLGTDSPGPPGNPIVARSDLDFRARWETPFSPDDTLPSVFHASSGDLRVPFMNRFGDIAVKKLPGSSWTAFSLPYAGCDLELLLLLPPRGATPEDVRTGLADALAAEWYTPAPPPSPAFLSMPRIAFPAGVPDLVPALRSLGLEAFCVPGTTDLSPIDPETPPYLHSLLQSLPFTVTESGTAPFPALAPSSPPPFSPAKSQRLLLNRPFVFALRDIRSGLLLLLGQVFAPPD